MLAGTQPQPSRAVANDVGDGLDEDVADVLEHRAARCPADQPRAAPDEHGAVSVDEDPERFAPRPARRANDRLRTPAAATIASTLPPGVLRAPAEPGLAIAPSPVPVNGPRLVVIQVRPSVSKASRCIPSTGKRSPPTATKCSPRR